jgi:hypothetical protein
MIEKQTIYKEDGRDETLILKEKFVGDGTAEMKIRSLDGEGEGDGIAIEVSDDRVAKSGDYTPFTLNEREAKVLHQFLSEQIKNFDAPMAG